jgi:hypothetical protein
MRCGVDKSFISVKSEGSAIAQAVSCRLSTAAALSGNVGFMVDKVALGQVFPEHFGLPSQSFRHHAKWSQSHPTPKK